MTTLKAVRIRSCGGPEALELADIEKPEPRDDEVLIRVRVASINPVDYKIRSGTYPVVRQDPLPKVLGRERRRRSRALRPCRAQLQGGGYGLCHARRRLIDQGRVHPHVCAVLELKDAREAQAQRQRHHSQGKVVLQMG